MNLSRGSATLLLESTYVYPSYRIRWSSSGILFSGCLSLVGELGVGAKRSVRVESGKDGRNLSNFHTCPMEYGEESETN